MNYIDTQKSSYPINSAPHSYKELNQFQFIQGTDHRHILPEAASLVNNRMLCYDGINRAGNANRAPSLLSSAPTIQSRDMGSSQVVHQQAQSFVHQFGGMGQIYPYSREMEKQVVVSDGEPSDSRSNNNYYHYGPDWSSAGGGRGFQQMLPFGW